jgi:putative heme-binding domain-containing protein
MISRSRAGLAFVTVLIGSVLSTAGLAEDPAVHVLEPGFRARLLPSELTNINGVSFGPDGALYALMYDGKVHRLTDTDGDGLQDTTEPYWDRTPLVSPIAMAWGPDGALYVSSHRKVSRLVDSDGDGRGDHEEVVADGWPQVPSGSGLVDAMGLAFDEEGRLHLGLGCADFTNPYLLKDGRPGYRRDAETGTILRFAADFGSREILATGLRFTYALKFNRAGDLFATDQEGETWLPGGNPLDEIDHIQAGRHYGWPPRHPEYLPDVADEPPVVGFRPQHQSACGLVFNEPAKGGARFGPESWAGDAFVALYSRGRVNRVTLVKTPAGYVAADRPFATFNRMPTDVAISPDGALYVALHSGAPDWGTGPQGPGTIVRIDAAEGAERAPRAAFAWPVSPIEVRLVFAGSAPDADALVRLAGTPIDFGVHARAGDRFEAYKPPYKAVEAQQAAPRGSLTVAGARIDPELDPSTVVLATDPHPQDATYVLRLPPLQGVEGGPEAPPLDLEYSFAGVEANWEPAPDAAPAPLSLWWPHLDPDVTHRLTAGSRLHAAQRRALAEPGTLALRTLVRLPQGASLTLNAGGSLRLEEGTLAGEDGVLADEGRRMTFTAPGPDAGELFVIVATGGTPDGPPTLHAAYHTAADPMPRPLPLDAFRLPWAPPAPPPSATVPEAASALAGGDPAKGEAIFFSEEARCSSCHRVGGKGGLVGPDLSNLRERSLASVAHDIQEPSATIHPDYVPYTVSLKDGRVLAGVVRADGPDALKVIDTNAQETRVARAEIEEIRPSATSIMPVGLAGVIGEQRLKDLLAYLTTRPAAEGTKPTK